MKERIEMNEHVISRSENTNWKMDYHNYTYYLLCNKVYHRRAIDIMPYSGIENEYKFCPVCGSNISELIKTYFGQ